MAHGVVSIGTVIQTERENDTQGYGIQGHGVFSAYQDSHTQLLLFDTISLRPIENSFNT